VYHVEVRQFPNVARTFNLTEAELSARVLVPWARGQLVELGERKWEPARAKLTVLEGREMRSDEMGLGRGWQNASREAQDVTARVLSAVQTGAGVEAPAAAKAFKDVVREQCESGRLAVHQVLWLANSRHPEWRVSERLALSEQAVWELLHEERLTLLKRVAGEGGNRYTEADRSEWQPALLTWRTWSDAEEPRWFLEARELA
jgi:hypothetical protein